MSINNHPIKVFAGTKSRYLGESICKELGIELGKMKTEYFADGEFEVGFEESIRGAEVYLVQSTFPKADNLMELLLMIDAAKACFCGYHSCRYSLFRLGPSGPQR